MDALRWKVKKNASADLPILRTLGDAYEAGHEALDPEAPEEFRSAYRELIASARKAFASKPSPLGPPKGHFANLSSSLWEFAYWWGGRDGGAGAGAPAMGRQANLRDGPVGRVLDKVWKILYDIEYELRQSAYDYHDAAHFRGGPAQKDAEKMIALIEECVEQIEHVSGVTFKELAEAEKKFVKQFRDPADYSDSMREETFSR